MGECAGGGGQDQGWAASMKARGHMCNIASYGARALGDIASAVLGLIERYPLTSNSYFPLLAIMLSSSLAVAAS